MGFEYVFLQLYSSLLQFPQLGLYVHVFAIFTYVFSIKAQPFNGQVFPAKCPDVVEDTFLFLQKISVMFRKAPKSCAVKKTLIYLKTFITNGKLNTHHLFVVPTYLSIRNVL